LLCELQATQLQIPVRRPEVAETTALGAAFLAGLATGVWGSTDELHDTWRLDRRIEPGKRDDADYERWCDAIRRLRTPIMHESTESEREKG
jgi:glycerol kinase